MRIAAWNVCSSFRGGKLEKFKLEMVGYKVVKAGEII